jgi:glutamate-1-semialdehyde 2,1-aminomutase
MPTQTDWIARARAVLPAGGFGNFDPGLVIREGCGARVWDEDGNEFVDLLIGSGPMLVGHSHPEVLEAVFEQLPKGQTFFANNALGVELAERIVSAVPCAERVRFVSTGGEADMFALRLARAATGREKIVKFEGGYHGMSAEAQMSLSPTRLANFPEAAPDSAGIPESVRRAVLVAPFNDAAFLESLMAEHASEVAAVIIEPLQRIIPPEPGFLQAVRSLCDRHGIVLIFDEVVTGFRLAWGGAQEAYGVTPDLCTLGKVIGGGFPLAALAGRADLMEHFDKAAVGAERWLMQVGTLSGNPVAAAAGLKTLEILARPGAYETLRAKGAALMGAFASALDAAGAPHRIVGDPTLFEAIFTDAPVRAYRDVLRQNVAAAAAFNAAMRAQGVLKSAGKAYPCLVLNETDIAQVAEAARRAARAASEAF